jgi:mRNA interferase MazF
MSPRPGEVWLADLGLAAKPRPVVIMSRYDPDPPRALVIYYITLFIMYILYKH